MNQASLKSLFLCSGLWHGAAWHYVAWGGLNGLFSVLEDVSRPVRDKIERKLSVDRGAFMYRALQRIVTFDELRLFIACPIKPPVEQCQHNPCVYDPPEYNLLSKNRGLYVLSTIHR